MNVKYLSFSVFLIIISISQPVLSAAAFPIIQLDNDLNSMNILLNIYNPPQILTDCYNLTNEKHSCSKHFSIILPLWLESIDNKSVTIFEPRRFILFNPQTSAEVINNCRGFSTGSELSLGLEISRSSINIDAAERFVDTPFSWNLNDFNSTCYIYKIPVYNPLIVDQNNSKMYPFDSYNMKFGFLFPYETNFQGVISVPNKFAITSFQINATDVQKTLSKGNSGYFNVKSKMNESEMFVVQFSRLPDLGSQLLTGFIIIILPILLFLFFLLSPSPEQDNTRTSRIVIFYLAIIPIFISLIQFLADKQTTKFTLFDLSVAMTLAFLTLSIVKDFVYKKLFDATIKRLIWAIIIILPLLIIFLSA